MITNLLILALSIAALLWSANHLVLGASGLARHFQIPPLFIGLTIVAIGTTAPEIMVAVAAAMAGKTPMALGNAIGSNIANIGLVLGLTAVLQPIPSKSSLVKREYPILFIIMLTAYILMVDGYISRLDGLILLTGSLGLIIYFAWMSKQQRKKDPFQQEMEEILKQQRSLLLNVTSLGLGFIFLPISAHVLVNSASKIAMAWGVSELTVGLTIVAIGTSLPELAASAVAAIKHEEDIAIGNILGSNMFNILLVMAFPAIISPDKVATELLWRDIPMMIFLSLLLFLFYFSRKKMIQRYQGILLLFIYLAYLFYIL